MTILLDPGLLKPITPKFHHDWKIWEKKNFNIHRGVVEFGAGHIASIDILANEVREGVREEFGPAWWRGFGFGTVIHFHELPADFMTICQHVDTRNKRHGVWQWIIVCLEEEKAAVAIHTWLHGYLRPVYESVLQHLSSSGFECYSCDADVDVLIATLQRITKTGRLIRSIAGIIT